MIHLSTIALAFLALALLQDVDYKFKCPNELTGLQRNHFLRQTEVSRYDRYQTAWQIASDVGKRLSQPTKEKLWEKNIAVRVDRACAVNQAIDQVGLSVEANILDENRKSIERLNTELRQSVVGQSIPQACLELSNKISSLRRALQDSNKLSTLVQFQPRRIGTNKTELWMLVEVFESDPEYPVFPRCLHYNLALELGLKRMVRIEPHPETDITAKLLLEDLRTPRKANRINTVRSLPAIPEDGLSFEQREDKYQFAVAKNSRSEIYQFEVIAQGTSPADSPKFDRVIDRLINRLSDRIPSGKTLSFDELHVMLGEFASGFRKDFKSEYVLVFAIEPYHHGNFTYEQLVVHCLDLDTDQKK